MRDFKRILAHADTTAAAQPALDRAAALARHVGAALTIVDIASELPRHARRLLPDALLARLEPDRAARLTALARALEGGAAWHVPISTAVLSGKPAIAICREVLRGGHDVLLRSLATRPGAAGPGFDALDMQLLRKCPSPVWLVGSRPPGSGRVLAAIDPNSDDPTEQALNHRIIEMALYLVEVEYRELVVLNVWNAFGESLLSPLASDAEVSAYVDAARQAAEHELHECLAPFGHRLDRAIIRLEQGDPGELIPALAVAEEVDLVVMGSVARTGIAGLVMGNTAERILGSLPCSVITVKPEGFVSPVTLED